MADRWALNPEVECSNHSSPANLRSIKMKKIIFVLLFLSGCATNGTIMKSFDGSELLVQETICCFQVKYNKMAVFDTRHASCDDTAYHLNVQLESYRKMEEATNRNQNKNTCTYTIQYKCYSESRWKLQLQNKNYVEE